MNMITFSPIRMMAMGYYAARAAGADAKQEEGARMGHFLTRLATIGGPFYVKMGQILSTRSDLLPPGAIRALQTLQDNVPPDSFADVRAQIERSYGKPIHEVFARFEETPVASASIAQVHRATLRSGEEVAVKIRRKNVRRQMMRSLRFMSGMTGLMSRVVPAMRRMHAKERMSEFRRLLAEQLDFQIELHNLEQLRRNFLKHEYIGTPQPYPELCNEAVLVMEFVEGVRALDFEQIDVSPKVMAGRLQNAIYTMLYFDGVCHGDPHPGNMIFSKDGKITFIDFGIVAYLSEDEKWGLSSFYYAATSHQWELALRRFTKCFVQSDADLMESGKYRDRMARVLKHHFQDQADNWNTMAFFQDVSRVLHDFNATYTPNFTKAELAMMSCEGFAKQMDPHLDIWGNARNFSDQYSPFVGDGIREYLDAWYAEKAPNAMALRERAKKSLIASTHLDRYFFPSNYPLFVERGYGSHVVDVDGNDLIDLSCGYGPNILGYGNPVARTAQIEAAATSNINALGHVREVELAEVLVDAFPGADLAVFSNSGTESVIHALRLCRTYRPKAKMIVKCEGHYHGFSDQAMVSSWFRVKGETWDPEPVAGCQGTPQHVVDATRVVQFNHPHSLDVIRKHADDIAAVLLEPMQAGAGRIEVEYLKALRALCTELDIPLVFDEVVTGFRVAYGGVQTLAGVEPDVTCLGKIIGGGLPAGAIVGKRHILEKGRTTGDPFRDYEERAFLGGTMSGNYQSCSAGLAVLNHLKAHPEIYEGLVRKTDYLRDRFRSAADARNVNMHLKASHSMFGISFTHKTPKHFREAMQGANFKATLALAYLMRSRGVYMPELHGFLISDAHSIDDLAQVGDAFESCLDQMDGLGMFVR
jgi:glutamate-1-semialdehyde 2,1-aminomutase